LGGIRLEMEGVQLDGTVQNRLNALQHSIADATL
jgi:F0F1-type ATP synthase delta subunit